ncbi:MAG: hypothetical protein NT166_07870 [Candidatus Aminicenantes bacterium]|nr:hypothetical protein [Candidatus Aminicenantes bacterium]
MSKDLEIIKKLERQIGRELISRHIDSLWRSHSYTVDKNKNVIGLNLSDLKLFDISILQELKNLTRLYLAPIYSRIFALLRNQRI